MPTSNRANWAATTPWGGIQGKPPFLDGPTGDIKISDVDGLQAALDGKMPKGALAKVATTGQYNDLLGKPVFGSAAFADVDNFVMAPTASRFQTDEVALVAGQQSYPVVFSPVMVSIPKTYLQVLMADATGELFSATLQEDVSDETGFTLWLSGVPTVSAGKVRWRSVVEQTPT